MSDQPIRTWRLTADTLHAGHLSDGCWVDSEEDTPVVIELEPVLDLLERWVNPVMNTGALSESDALLREHGRLS